jgi:hypothetical protein
LKISIDDYSHNRILVKNLLKRKGVDNYKNIASEFAVTSGCPVFVVYYYIAEEIGFNEWILERMQKLAKFYSYTSIESTKDQGFSIGFDKNILLGYNDVKKEEEKPKRTRRKKNDS